MNLREVGLVVKDIDERSKIHLFSTQSAHKAKDLDAFWCFRRMTAKGKGQLNHEEI